MRIAMGVEYDGTVFCGWQYQDHCRSVQQAVEEALSQVADHPVRTVCAGRTDTGVHATAQVIHFDTEAVRPEHAWVMGGNVNLPRAVSLRWARVVDEDFHARYSAVARTYRYLILNRGQRPALLRRRVCWEHRPLDAERMQAAGELLLGEHDFSAFRAAGCQAKHPVRTIERLRVARHGELIRIDVTANAFLHHMVRNIAGTLIKVGRGERPVAWVGEVLAGRDRTAAGITAPPEGLYFVQVVYPERFGLPTAPVWPLIGGEGMV